jgi:predicted RNA binding protein YcfA (HicA-like mRNA interferase family)
MTSPDDLIGRARRSAGNLTQRDLTRLARQLGFNIVTKRGKGGHVAAVRADARRPVTIPTKINRKVALDIISQLERSA